MLHFNETRSDTALIFAALLKMIRSGSRTWVLMNPRKWGTDPRDVPAIYLRDKFNALVPHVAMVDKFGYKDPSEDKNPRIIISSYKRFLNKYLEREVSGH